MNKYRSIAGTLLLLALCTIALGSTKGSSRLRAQIARDNYTQLLECRFYPELFPTRPVAGLGQSTIALVAEAYHNTVSAIIDAHAVDSGSVVCADEPYRKPTDALRSLAELLPPWSYGASLTEDDMSAVLLTYLSAFECALMDLEQNVIQEATADAMEESIGEQPNNTDNIDPTVSDIGREARIRATRADREMRVARDALHRTLRYIGATERLDALKRNLSCLERASLDIRNNVALMAEAAQCIDTIRGRSSLRTLAP